MEHPISDAYDYGTCDICETPMHAQSITQDLWIRGALLVLEHVPAGVCPQCGAKVVTATVGRRIAALLGNAERIATAPRMAVPVLSLEESPHTTPESVER